MEALREQGDDLFITGQNLIETWNVATRPVDRNGLGLNPDRAGRLVDQLERAFPRLTDPADTYERWREIVEDFGVSGVQVHDARLVAIMLAHEMKAILTFNGGDFECYVTLGIRAIDPKSF